MSVVYVDGLPGLEDPDCTLRLRVRGPAAFVRSPRFVARLSLPSGNVDWLIERPAVRFAESTHNLPRRINPFSGSNFWCSEVDELVADTLPTESGGLMVSGRHAGTGKQLWEQFIPIPDAADWAEPSPAWPGTQTEEIYSFLANDPNCLVVCLFRQSRRSCCVYPARGIDVRTLPPYACQTDAVRFDPLTGRSLWRGSFRDLRVEILERENFTGTWSNDREVGVVNLETGINRTLRESTNHLGWPVRDTSGLISVPWHSKREVGVDWINQEGQRIRQAVWRQSGVQSTKLHATQSGLALQSSDQTLWWLGNEESPLWSVRAKPYIYHVYCSPATDVFVGTDGRGGRLFGYDAVSGHETLNIKPTLGGAGVLAKVPDHDVLVAKFWVSRNDPTAGRLFVLSMKDRAHTLGYQCQELIGTWNHGAVCLAGSNRERLSIVDIRSS